MVQTVTCIGALHPKPMFIKLPTTQYRHDQWFKLLLRACCPSGKTLIYLWGKPEPSRKLSQKINMNLEGEKSDENMLIQVVNKWRLNFYQLNNQNIGPEVHKHVAMPAKNHSTSINYARANSGSKGSSILYLGVTLSSLWTGRNIHCMSRT